MEDKEKQQEVLVETSERGFCRVSHVWDKETNTH